MQRREREYAATSTDATTRARMQRRKREYADTSAGRVDSVLHDCSLRFEFSSPSVRASIRVDAPAIMDAAIVFQHVMLEFLMRAPTVIVERDPQNIIDWDAMYRARDVAHVLLLTSGSCAAYRRRTWKDGMTLRVSWTTSFARHQMTTIRAIVMTHHRDRSRFPTDLSVVPSTDPHVRESSVAVNNFRANEMGQHDVDEVPYEEWHRDWVEDDRRDA
jgi:hypothetical protein